MRPSFDLGPAHLPPVLGRDGVLLNAGLLDHGHPLNLGRDRTGRCCAAWWAEFDRRGVEAFEDDGHHAPRGLPGVVVQAPDAEGHFKIAVETPRGTVIVGATLLPHLIRRGEHGRETLPLLEPEAGNMAEGNTTEATPGAPLRTGVVQGGDGETPFVAVEGRHLLPRPACAGPCATGGRCPMCGEDLCPTCWRHAWDRGERPVGCDRRHLEERHGQSDLRVPPDLRRGDDPVRTPAREAPGAAPMLQGLPQPEGDRGDLRGGNGRNGEALPLGMQDESARADRDDERHLGRGPDRAPAIPCRYCRTGSALRYEQTRKLTGKAELAELKCPACLAVTLHHPAPIEVVLAEECLCGACCRRRAFDEAAAWRRAA